MSMFSVTVGCEEAGLCDKSRSLKAFQLQKHRVAIYDNGFSSSEKLWKQWQLFYPPLQ